MSELAGNGCQIIVPFEERKPLKEIERSILKKYRKYTWSKFIKAIKDYKLVEEGDKIAVAISGGKDSLLMAKMFQELKRHGQVNFELEFIAMDPGYHPDIRQLLIDNCEYLEIPIKLFDANIFEVADEIASDYPCYMCARMRRGALYNKAEELGCNKLALGHHFDDVIETTMLNLLCAGNFKTMLPKLNSTNFDGIQIIRPLYYIREESIIKFIQNSGIWPLNCACMVAAKKTGNKRYEIKDLIKSLGENFQEVEKSIFRAAQNVYLDSVLGWDQDGKKHSFLEKFENGDIEINKLAGEIYIQRFFFMIIMIKYNYSNVERGIVLKKIYMDFEMNMPNSKGKRDGFKAEIIAIGAIKYDIKTGKIDKFKSLIKPITNQEVFPHIEELTHITTKDLENAPTYERVMREFKSWLGIFSEIEGIYTFGNLDLTCFNYTDRLSSQKYNHPRFLNNIRDLFVDIKDKYINYGIKCMNYVSLKNLLEYANVQFCGDAHDPLYDAYNLYILDKVLQENNKIRDLLVIHDFLKVPFIALNEELESRFEEYRQYLYNKSGEFDIYCISLEIIKTIKEYLISIKKVNVHDIDVIRDISKKLEVLDKLKDINEGYFYVLDNLYLDMKELLEDALLYKLNQKEYEEEIDNILDLFNEDLQLENITEVATDIT